MRELAPHRIPALVPIRYVTTLLLQGRPYYRFLVYFRICGIPVYLGAADLVHLNGRSIYCPVVSALLASSQGSRGYSGMRRACLRGVDMDTF